MERHGCFPKTAKAGKIQKQYAPFILNTLLSYPDGTTRVSKDAFADKVNDLVFVSHVQKLDKQYIGKYLKRQCLDKTFSSFFRVYPNQNGIVFLLNPRNREYITTMFPEYLLEENKPLV